MTFFRWAGALALALLLSPCAALAQVPSTAKAQVPGGFLPAGANYCSNDSGTTWVPCPTSSGGGGGGSSGPVRATSTVSPGTITTANTYQSALAANSARNGCLLQNTSATTLRIFLGAPGSATDASAVQIAAGGSFSCASPGGVILTDQVSVAASTSSATFVIVSQ
ncbi:hypothetical protein [Sphingobium sp.]|uniref:hypothetical protein n=1 Tax=Sphingobium sp. TaxID=1912891 RepID=UPI003BB59678